MKMNSGNKKGSAFRRALLHIRRSKAADILSIIIVAAALVLIVLSPAICRETTRENESAEEPAAKAEPLTIEIPEPCDIGSVRVVSGDNLIYEYYGNVEIKNDGKNGKKIEILIEHPEGTWPCSCAEDTPE